MGSVRRGDCELIWLGHDQRRAGKVTELNASGRKSAIRRGAAEWRRSCRDSPSSPREHPDAPRRTR